MVFPHYADTILGSRVSDIDTPEGRSMRIHHESGTSILVGIGFSECFEQRGFKSPVR
jgi:hypothetical protein